ncbi:hypothetical protein QFW96_24675 [Saccharopolyspora sp. TS4A08]|uniref:Uncharacterized protein n=1 Tax=Saccharopolyspora ipomoeae TaxID=3042027 RepID=A0ABT6PV06_9PSEU|nr:hypothetical protein [Saccharopolyspora sp. TS4A08]MDI2031844.1 hypothetical protein [Saccharopolyspora sp. TS4A08]
MGEQDTDSEHEDAEAFETEHGGEESQEGERLAERGEPESGTPDRRLGLIADPDMPEQVTRRLADDLPELLGEQHSWAVEVDVDPVTAGRHSTRDILASTRERMGEHDWDHAICLTDLPVRANGRPVVAETDLEGGVAVVSLPALGGTGVYRRARRVVLQIVDELTGRSGGGGNRYGLDNAVSRLLAPVVRHELGGEQEVDVRYSTTRRRGRLRLLSGMVRSNQPAQLVFGLRSALAAAVATSAFGLSSSTIWQIGDQLGVFRQIIAGLVSVVLLVLWLITAHGLWEKRRSGGDREQVLLYNTSTVATLTIGVGVMYVGLFAINLAVALFIVPPNLLASSLGHPADFTRYLALAWGFTTMGVIAGALGSSLESDRAVRQAAYGYREEQRRSEQVH